MKTIKDYNLTDANESVAWNGTLILEKGRKNYYLRYHSGNSNHKEIKTQVSAEMSKKLVNMHGSEAIEFLY